MNEQNIPTAPEQSAPAAPETAAPRAPAEEAVTVGALRGAIERKAQQRARRAAEESAARWSREADELAAQCPDFDLGAALSDAQFCALLRAGVDVRTAWFALHAQALLEAACVRAGRSAEQRVAEHIRARGLRPAENGLGGGGAGIVVRPDVSRMSRADRAALAGHAAIAADDRADVRAAFTVAVTGLRQLAAAYPGHVAEDTGRVPAQETKPNGSAAAGRCPGAVPGSGQQRKKET